MKISTIDRNHELHLNLNDDSSSVRRTSDGAVLMTFDSSLYVSLPGQKDYIAKLGTDMQGNWRLREQFSGNAVTVAPEAPQNINGLEPTFRLEIAFFKAWQQANP